MYNLFFAILGINSFAISLHLQQLRKKKITKSGCRPPAINFPHQMCACSNRNRQGAFNLI
jgi:hypothetical protein